MKEIFFMLSADQKRYSFLLMQLKDRDNVGTDTYPIIMKYALDLLIRAEFCICGNKQSTDENRGGVGERHPKVRTGQKIVQKQQGGIK